MLTRRGLAGYRHGSLFLTFFQKLHPQYNANSPSKMKNIVPILTRHRSNHVNCRVCCCVTATLTVSCFAIYTVSTRSFSRHSVFHRSFTTYTVSPCVHRSTHTESRIWIESCCMWFWYTVSVRTFSTMTSFSLCIRGTMPR